MRTHPMHAICQISCAPLTPAGDSTRRWSWVTATRRVQMIRVSDGLLGDSRPGRACRRLGPGSIASPNRMKLVPKLTVMFILSTSAVLGVNGYLRVRREVGLFESDRVRDHQLIARVVAHAALAVWRTDGPLRAIAMVNELGSRSSKPVSYTHLTLP